MQIPEPYESILGIQKKLFFKGDTALLIFDEDPTKQRIVIPKDENEIWELHSNARYGDYDYAVFRISDYANAKNEGREEEFFKDILKRYLTDDNPIEGEKTLDSDLVFSTNRKYPRTFSRDIKNAISDEIELEGSVGRKRLELIVGEAESVLDRHITEVSLKPLQALDDRITRRMVANGYAPETVAAYTDELNIYNQYAGTSERVFGLAGGMLLHGISGLSSEALFLADTTSLQIGFIGYEMNYDEEQRREGIVYTGRFDKDVVVVSMTDSHTFAHEVGHSLSCYMGDLIGSVKVGRKILASNSDDFRQAVDSDIVNLNPDDYEKFSNMLPAHLILRFSYRMSDVYEEQFANFYEYLAHYGKEEMERAFPETSRFVREKEREAAEVVLTSRPQQGRLAEVGAVVS